jgi:translation initiation factor IF-3
MDYGKFKFDEAQKAKESRRKSQGAGIKEMKYRPKIGPGDFDTKTRLVAKFLDEGHKVKITIMFRGREMSHPELGKRILDQVAETVASVAKVEAAPKLDGRNMIMVLAPDRRAQARKPSGNGARGASDRQEDAEPVEAELSAPAGGEAPSRVGSHSAAAPASAGAHMSAAPGGSPAAPSP